MNIQLFKTPFFLGLFITMSVVGCMSSSDSEPEVSQEDQEFAFNSCSEQVNDIDWAFAESRAEGLDCYNAAEDSIQSIVFNIADEPEEVSLLVFTKSGEMVDYISELEQQPEPNPSYYSGELTNSDQQALLNCVKKLKEGTYTYVASVGAYCPSIGNEYTTIY